jgi:hypothetical protein
LRLYDLFCDDYFKHIIFVCVYIYINGGIYINNNIKLLKSLDNIGFSDKIVLNKGVLLLLISDKCNIDIINYMNSLLYCTEIDNKYDITNQYFDVNDIDYCKDKYNILGDVNNILFLIEDSLSKDNYVFEYLNLNYYMVSSLDSEINDNFCITCINNEKSSTEKLFFIKNNRVNYKNRFIFSVF